MTTFSTYHLELLKSKVLQTVGFANITPADCKIISAQITAKTRQRISETTLKRIYGFAFSKFKPSLFTIDVLSKYCGYKGWEDFCEKHDTNQNVALPESEVNWNIIQQNASKITNFTLQALKNRSGILYSQTIKRRFIDHHFDEFLHSNNTGTVICAPAGYGKTIAICHWVEEQIAASAFNGKNDIILFFSSNALMSVLLTGRDINDWILALLGYSADDDLNTLMDINQRKGSKFYLIIDGFDEHTLKSEQFSTILNQLVDIFSFYQLHDWFKLVLIMRTSTWINNRHDMEVGAHSWFTGFQPNDRTQENVPLFSVQEIKELCLKINPSIQNFIALDVAESFNHPLYFQFYYKQHKEDFSLNNVDHLSIYELISAFILNKVYIGRHSAEKILFVQTLVEEMDIKNKIYDIDKLKVNHLIKQYSHAYNDLLSIGFLRELNESNNYQYNTRIKFGNNHFLEHSIASTLLYNNGERFDAELIHKINELFDQNEHKVAILKWCVIHAIKNGQQNNFERLTETRLNASEKSEFILFLGDLLDKECSAAKKTDSFLQFFKQDFNEKMFNYFFGLELISVDYKKTLNTLLRFELTNRKKILVYTSLAVIAAIRLDLTEMNGYLNKLKTFQKEDYLTFPINPLNCIDTIYNYLKNGVLKKEALVDLTKLSFSPPEDPQSLKKTASNDMLYLLGLHTLMFCHNPKKLLRVINIFKTIYKNDDQEYKATPYGFFIKTLTADAYYKMEDHEKVYEIYQDIAKIYQNNENLLTNYMITLFHTLKINALINTPHENLILNEVKYINTIIEDSGYKISKLYMLSLLLRNDSYLIAYPKFHKQIFYEYSKLIRDNGLSPDTFNHHFTLHD